MMSSLLTDLVLCNVVLKKMIARQRPCWLNETVQLLVNNPKDYSFPSGHTMASFAVAPIIYRANKKWGIAAYILAGLIGFSRMYLYVHYPSDVLGGMLIGCLCGVVSVFLVKDKKFSIKKQSNQVDSASS